VLSTPGQEIRLPRGTVLTLPLDRAIDVRVPILEGHGGWVIQGRQSNRLIFSPATFSMRPSSV
jgi:hypothetical protein